MDVIKASDLNNEALALESAGDYEGAEKKHLEALSLKKKSKFVKPIGIALTENGLGELYLKMGKLDEAENLLKSAYQTRSHYDNFDKSCTADNLGRLYEMKGDVQKAIEWRTNVPNRMICSYFECPKSKFGSFSGLGELKKCGRCKCVFYCGKECQQQDWGRHKPFCKVLTN